MNIIFKPECKTEIIEPTYDLPIIGEPISKTGASANNSNAYGVIVGIIGDGSSRRVRVMTDGYIDYDKVKDNYMEYTDEAINALTGITLCSGGKLPTGVQPFEFDNSLISSGQYSLTNLAQVQKAIDNNMMFNIVYSGTSNDVTVFFKLTLPYIKDSMVISDLSGNIVSNQYESFGKSFNLEIKLNADDYANGVITPTSATLYVKSKPVTVVKIYASTF